MTGRNLHHGWLTLISGCLFLLCLTVFAGSCINVDQEITLNNSGGGSMKVVVATKQSFYSSEEFGTTANDIAYAFEEITFMEGVALVSEREYESGDMHVWENRYTFQDIRKLGNQDLEITFEPDGDDTVLSLVAVLVNENHPGLTEEELEKEEVQQLLEDLAGYRYRLQVNVPRPIKEASRGQVEDRTIAWEMTLDRVLNPRRKTMRMRVVY